MVGARDLLFSSGPRCLDFVWRGSGLDGLVVSASHPGWLYASSYDGVVRLSRDGGEHWVVQDRHAPGSIVGVVGARADVLYASDRRGLSASSDGGRSWQALNCEMLVEAVSATRDGKTIFVAAGSDIKTGEGGGLYQSSDAGRSWRRDTDLPDGNLNVNAVLVDPRRPTYVYAGTETGGILRSIDGGRHFRWRTLGRPSLGFPHGDQVTALVASASGAAVVWAGTRDHGIFRGAGHGLGWAAAGLAHRYVEQLVADPRLPDRLYAALSDYSTPTYDYSRPELVTVSAGGRLRRVSRVRGHWYLTASPTGDAIYAWWDHKILISRDHGVTWTRLPRFP